MIERQKRIYDIVNHHGNATVEQLANAVFASNATIRRDLNEMERNGLLVRVWGGAVAVNKINGDPPGFIRSITNKNHKKKIAQNAISFLHDNMSVFLPSGSTVTELSKLFNMFENLTVITTGLDIINTLNKYSSIKLIVPGGEIYEHYDFAGTLAGNNIDGFNADLFFFSCSGITADGFTSNDIHRLDIIQKMHANSGQTILLVDTSKIGKKSTYKGFPFDDIDYVIMEKMPEDKDLIKILGKKLITTKTFRSRF